MGHLCTEEIMKTFYWHTQKTSYTVSPPPPAQLPSADTITDPDNYKMVSLSVATRQWWANLDQASKDLDKTIFRDLSPTPLP